MPLYISVLGLCNTNEVDRLEYASLEPLSCMVTLESRSPASELDPAALVFDACMLLVSRKWCILSLVSKVKELR